MDTKRLAAQLGSYEGLRRSIQLTAAGIAAGLKAEKFVDKTKHVADDALRNLRKMLPILDVVCDLVPAVERVTRQKATWSYTPDSAVSAYREIKSSDGWFFVVTASTINCGMFEVVKAFSPQRKKMFPGELIYNAIQRPLLINLNAFGE